MKKIEQVYREILYHAIEKKNMKLTQLELSQTLGLSLSTINRAVKKLERMNAVKIGKMNFKVIDARKILYLWASIRNLEKDIIYLTRLEMPVKEIEKNIPEIIFAAFSAYKFKFNDVPADYSEVYVYADEEQLKEIKKRFPKKKGNENLFILKADKNAEKYGKTCTIAGIFVDLWNIKSWYASEFLKAIEEKINKIIQEK